MLRKVPSCWLVLITLFYKPADLHINDRRRVSG